MVAVGGCDCVGYACVAVVGAGVLSSVVVGAVGYCDVGEASAAGSDVGADYVYSDFGVALV